MTKFKLPIIIIAIAVLTFSLGFNFGKGSQASGYAVNSSKIDLTQFWDVWGRLKKDYLDKSKIDQQKMVWGAISGMVSSLDDPYTVFLTPQQNKETNEELGGTFEGIGAQLGIKDKKIVVIAPLKGNPAEKAGIKSGDFIYKIDGKETTSLSLVEAVSKIRGKKGTEVALTILRDNENKPRDIKVVRDTILVKTVDWEVQAADSILPITNSRKFVVLRLSRFGDNTNSEWDKSVSEIETELTKDKNISGIVLDLRDNPGGYFSSAIYVASEFLDSGIVAKQQNADGSVIESKVTRKGKLLNIPLTVLINKGSASAAEILAGALSERSRAKIIGETSFGKGSVQEREDLGGGAGLHITIAKWLLPSGKWINGVGIKPDFAVAEDATGSVDLQLNKAIEVLGNGI